MKKIFIAFMVLAILSTLFSFSAIAEGESPLEILPTPEYVIAGDLDDNELFEEVEKFESKPANDSYNAAATMASASNCYLYNGFYDGRKLDSVTSGDISVSAFTDISGKTIAFEDDGSTVLRYTQAFAQTSATSPYHFKRHLYSNGYFFITTSVIVPSAPSYRSGDVYPYSYCYDTVNNILYKLPFGVSEVNEFGEAYAFVTETKRNGSSTETTITKHMIKLKKYPIVSVFYNNEKVLFDQLPVIDNGRTLVPLRAIFEKIGAEVSWDGETSTVTAVKDGTEIKLTLNSTTAYKNGEEITLDVPAKSVNGRTLVPVRFIADCFGVDVTWLPEYQRVVLTSK